MLQQLIIFIGTILNINGKCFQMKMENEVRKNNTCQNTDHQVKITEKYIYHFDYPQLTESGYVKIDLLNNIIVSFPEKPNVSVPHEIQLAQNSTVYINKQLHFSYEWLPIYNYNDLYKVRDMMTKAYYDYISIIDKQVLQDFSSKKYCPYYCSEIVTEHKTENFEISCFENKTNTCFDISIFNASKQKPAYCNEFRNLQIFIGGNLIFCGQRDLLNCNIPFNECHHIIYFMLLKLIQD
jgi:hypothetical protein